MDQIVWLVLPLMKCHCAN